MSTLNISPDGLRLAADILKKVADGMSAETDRDGHIAPIMNRLHEISDALRLVSEMTGGERDGCAF